MDGYIWGNYPVGSFAVDNDNRIWFSTLGLGVYDGLNWKLYTTDDGLLVIRYVNCVAIDSSQNVWISYGEYADGVSRFDGNTWKHLTTEDGLIDNKVGPIFVDKRGDVWFSTIYKIKSLSVYHDTTTTNVKEQNTTQHLPEMFQLQQNYPNPFNSQTLISYELKGDANIQLSILNLPGEEVIKLDNGYKTRGIYHIIWKAKDKMGKEVSSGIYFCVLQCNNFKAIKKITLIR